MAHDALRSLVSLAQKRFLSTASVVSSSPKSNYTVEFLTKTCGLPLDSALSTFSNFQLDEKKSQSHESVVSFLKSQGFETTQIAELVKKRPSILSCKVDDNLRPKFDLLIENGFTGSLLPELILSNPFILFRGLDSQLKLSLDYIREVLQSDQRVVAAIKRESWLLTSDIDRVIRPNIDFLLSIGLSPDFVAKMFLWQPRVIMQKVDRVVYAVEKAKAFGFDPNSMMFVHGVRVLLSMSEDTWRKKVELLRSLGWSYEDVLSTFRRDPQVLGTSEEKLRKLMGFFVNTLNMKPDAVISYPKLLMLGPERVQRRYNVMKVLMSRKLIKEQMKIAWTFMLGERDFLDKYVLNNLDKVPNLLEIYGVKVEAGRT